MNRTSCNRISLVMVAVLLWAFPGLADTDAVLQALGNHGLDAPSRAAIMEIFEEGARKEVPLDALRTRLQEGLVKRVQPEALQDALLQHVQALVQARRVLEAAGIHRRDDPIAASWVAVLARALESGLPVETFADVFTSRRGALSHRLQALIEAAEMMHLAGIAAEDVRAFLLAAVQRDLRRMETFRAARFWILQHREGLEAAEIQNRLWPAPPPDADHRQRRNQGRQRRGEDRGIGSPR